MQYLKSLFNNQVIRIKTIKEPSELYFIFFRLCQLITLVGVVYALVLLQPVASVGAEYADLSGLSSRIYLSLAIATVLTLVMTEVSLRLMDKGNAVGLYIGLIISLKCLIGWSFLVGLFGLYALLNPATQQKYLNTSPVWFKDMLSFCRINYTEQQK